MARREMVLNTIWATELADVSRDAKLVYVWSFTNQSCGMAGFYPVRPAQIAMELDMSTDEVMTACDELTAAGLVSYDGAWLWVRSRVKHIHSRTKQIAKSIAKDLAIVPDDHPFLAAFIDRYGDEAWLKSEVQVRFKRTSSEVQENLDSNSDFLNLKRTSPEVPLVVVVVNEAIQVLKKLWPSSKFDDHEFALRVVLERAPDIDLVVLESNASAYLDDPWRRENWPHGVQRVDRWVQDGNYAALKAPRNMAPPARKRSKYDLPHHQISKVGT